jgi:acyl-CoA reductase-like NAD-dependent aldehyde dehydrogenase
MNGQSSRSDRSSFLGIWERPGRVAHDVDEAVAAGVKVLTSGTADGPCYRPTIPADVPADASIHFEETFGSVLAAQPVEDAEEAVAVANATSDGLSAGFITSDNQRGFALARRIDAGVVHVNDQTIRNPSSIITRDGTGSYPI